MGSSFSSSTHDSLDTPYTPIRSGHREIRLLEIASGQFNDDLVMKLRIKRLEKKRPKYDALSYVWGKALCPREALLNGRRVKIGRNLDCALRHIRDILEESVESCPIWVDALCINQDDIQERNQQVQLMGNIYSSADTVIVWLGPERQDDQFVLQQIKTGDIPDTAEDAVRVLKALKRLCQRPWFGRLWIAQELVLAKHDPMLLLGRRRLSWYKLYNFIKKIHDERTSLVSQHNITLDPTAWPFWECVYFDQAARRVLFLGQIDIRKDASLTHQLYHTTGLLASDPRDKVFGLLSICTFTSRHEAIVADYSKTVQEVFSEATFRMLQVEVECPYATFQLQPLKSPNSTQSTTVMAGLPSWAFDLTIGTRASTPNGGLANEPYRLVPTQTDIVELERRISGLPNPFKSTSNFTQLSTVGAFLGTIVETTGDLFDSKGILGELAVQASALYDLYNRMIKPRHISARVFLQALTIDGDAVVDSVAFEQLLNERFESDHPQLQWGMPCREVLENLYTAEDSIMFITAERHVGMAYHPDFVNGIRPGDVVVGLFGINFPCILRVVPGGVDGRPAYNLINIAHIANHKWGHDFVENAPPKAKWRDFRKFGLIEYTLV